MSDEEHLDIDPCDKDEPGESKAAKAAKKVADEKAAKKAAATKEKRFQAAITAKAASEAAQKEIDDILGGMNPDQKVRMLAVMGVVSPNTKCKYDHEATMQRLIANTAPVRAVMEPHMADYEAVHYMSTLCVYWKSLMPLNHAQNKEHIAFMRHFNKERHHYGLPERGVAEALGDLSFGEEAGVDAGAD